MKLRKMQVYLLICISMTCSITLSDNWTSTINSGGTLLSEDNTPGFMYLNKNNESLIEVMDTDNDGVVDFLRYAHFSKTGEKKLIAEDCDFDGNIDFKWHYPNSSSLNRMEIWHEKKWYDVKKEEIPFIEVRGDRVKVSTVKGCLRALTSNK